MNKPINDPSKFIFFCSHNKNKYDKNEMRACLSQWYPAKMIGREVIGFDHSKMINLSEWEEFVENKEFLTCEHWMMLWKALLFKDFDVAKEVHSTKDPKAIRSLGRKVKNFDENIWTKYREDIVLAGNLLKFTQHDDLRYFLIETGDKEIVEAAYYDKIWGIGFNEINAIDTHRDKWGLNLLGKSLMNVRNRLKNCP